MTPGPAAEAPRAAGGDGISKAHASSGVAVVELFTSEGCSSCPPADDVLRSIVDESESSGRPVYALSLQVDYWNELGWADPYSAAAFTDRQRRYARALGAGGVFTPQMIVNGKDSFTGSDEEHARRAIEEALSRPAPVTLSLHVAGTAGAVQVRYDASPAPPGTTLTVALVDRLRTSDVTRGENAGRTMRHKNVVRALDTAPLASSGARAFALPPEGAGGGGDREVIGFVQDAAMDVLGAALASLPAESR